MLALAVLLTLTVASAQGTSEERGFGVGDESALLSPTYRRRHAVIIGIDAYEDPGYPDLAHAVSDARAVTRILIDRYGFAREDVQLILDRDATQDAIGAALEDGACNAKRIDEEDLLVVFYAGHGVTRESRRGSHGYLVPHSSTCCSCSTAVSEGSRRSARRLPWPPGSRTAPAR